MREDPQQYLFRSSKMCISIEDMKNFSLNFVKLLLITVICEILEYKSNILLPEGKL